MAGDTDGPFPTTGTCSRAERPPAQSTRRTVQDPQAATNTINTLAGELEGDAQRVATHLDGDITADVQTNPQVPRRQPRRWPRRAPTPLL